MKKILILVISIVVIVAIVRIAAKSDSKDMTATYMKNASFYGLKNLVEEEEFEATDQEMFSHADYKFWGIPDVN